MLPYISPKALFSISSDEIINSSFIKKQKKQFLAEFELNGVAEISLNGVSFDKSGIIAFLDGMEDPQEIIFHQFIDTHPALLAFLESGDLEIFNQNHQAELSTEKGFSKTMKSKVAPYYCYRYNEVLSKALKQRNWETLTLVCQSKPLIGIDHYSFCYQDAYQYLQLQVENLEEMAARIKKGKSPGSEVQDVCDELVISSLNTLPDHFEGIRNAYGMALEDLATSVFNEHKRARLTKLILRQGLKLTLNQDTKGRLTHVLNQLLKIEPDDEFIPEIEEKITKSIKKVKVWHIALAGIVLMKIVWMILS
ncbi:hypothetical protein N9933_01580 [bacterium]|nr:hypothetical protein [bacterium]